MSETGGSNSIYVIPVARVRESVETLLARKTHQFFPAYLYLRRLAAEQGRTNGLVPNWADLGERLEVVGGPEGKPYLRPFWPLARDAHQEWLNSNLAGSYSPSSLRGVPMRVVETDAAGRFNLRDHHWELALEHLLFGGPMPVLALAGFLFRDYGLVAPSPFGATEIIALFRRDYGYRPENDEEFHHLYDTDWVSAAGPWSEPWSDQAEDG